jgi:hypothetical protein
MFQKLNRFEKVLVINRFGKLFRKGRKCVHTTLIRFEYGCKSWIVSKSYQRDVFDITFQLILFRNAQTRNVFAKLLNVGLNSTQQKLFSWAQVYNIHSYYSAERLCRKRLADRILKQFNFCTHIRNESVSCERIYVLCETASQNDLIFTSEHVDFWNVLIWNNVSSSETKRKRWTQHYVSAEMFQKLPCVQISNLNRFAERFAKDVLCSSVLLLSICFVFYFLIDIILPDLSEFNVEFTPTFMLSSNVHIKTIRTSIEIFSKMHCAVRRRHLNMWCVLNRFSWNVISKTHYQYFFETIQLLKHIRTVY